MKRLSTDLHEGQWRVMGTRLTGSHLLELLKTIKTWKPGRKRSWRLSRAVEVYGHPKITRRRRDQALHLLKVNGYIQFDAEKGGWVCLEDTETFKGVALSELTWKLTEANDEENPYVEDPEGRFAGAFPELAYQVSKPGDWHNSEQFTGSKFHQLRAIFSHEELVRLVIRTVFTNRVSDWLEEDRNGGVIKKARLSMWRWGYTQRGYNSVVRFYNAVQRFEFGEGFEVRLDHPRGSNPTGWGLYHRDTYLDGAFAFCIYYKGQHVLTIGFSVTKWGIIINQVQLKKRKGNRFLYKLPQPLLLYVMARMEACFGNSFQLWLVDGASAVAAVKASYKDQACPELVVHSARIAAFYDQPLLWWDRGEELSVKGVTFRQLVAHPVKSAA